MNLQELMREQFGLEALVELPTLNMNGLVFHFRHYSGEDEQWSTSVAALKADTAGEAVMIQNRLLVCVSISKVEKDGEERALWQDFLPEGTQENFPEEMKAAEQTPFSALAQVKQAAAGAFLDFMASGPSSWINRLTEFYTENILPLAAADSLAEYDCPTKKCSPKTMEKREATRYCGNCGKQMKILRVVREGRVETNAPLPSASTT